MPKVVRVRAAGGPEVLKIEEEPLPQPGQGEVRLKVETIGLNRAEVMFRMGMYLEPLTPPSRIGYDAAGVVDAVGPGVTNVRVGQRVATVPSSPMSKYGVYGEYALVRALSVAPYPDVLSPREAAALWMSYLTVYGAFMLTTKIGKGDYVVIPAASSSLGFTAIQFCKREGAISIATTRGREKKQALLEAGSDHVVVTDDEDFVGRIMEITRGKGARIVFDPVSGPMLEKAANVAAPGGTIIEYGWLAAPAPAIYPLFPALVKQLTIVGYTLFGFTSDPAKVGAAVKYINDGITSGIFKPVVDDTKFTLDQIAEAHRYMESNQQKGKVVVTV